MKNGFILILFFYGFYQSVIAQEQDSINQPLILLNSQMLDNANLNVSFCNSFDVTLDGKILLSSLNQFYLLGWQEFMPLEPKMQVPIQSFAYTAADVLLMISGNSLCILDSLGQPAELFPLPSSNMGIATGDSVVYVYDKTKQEKGYAVYLLQENLSYLKLLELPTPVTDILEVNGNILFATQNRILSVNIANKKIETLVQLAKKQEKIISMTKDGINDALYFSTNDAVYTLKDKQAGCVMEQIGGLLKCYYNELYVFNPKKKFLISFYINDTSDNGKKENVNTEQEKKNTGKKTTTKKKR